MEIGTANGVMTEILSGISEGTEVLMDFNMSGGEAPQGEQTTNPFMPRPRNNRNGNGNNQQKRQ